MDLVWINAFSGMVPVHPISMSLPLPIGPTVFRFGPSPNSPPLLSFETLAGIVTFERFVHPLNT